jgi:hypothetical protein
MALLHNLSCRRCFNRSVLTTSIIAPLSAIFGYRAKAEDVKGTDTPGSPLSTRSHLLDTAADAVQGKRPIDAMSAYLNGFHFYADDMGRQVEANHFCTHLTEDFHQCVIYDSNLTTAKLIGIEYIVSERLFKTLPDDEKRLWHSHQYEVKSGELIAPGVPELAGHAFMKDLVNTYGKTWHTWQIDRDATFPLGIPQLMMGFTKDGQVNAAMLADRDKRFGTSTLRAKQNRADIVEPPIDAGANAWQGGKVMQLTLEEMPVQHLRG